MHRGAALGLDDVPRLGLAVAEAEVVAGERAAGVEVDGQALAGVEQLDQQGRVGAEARDVLGAEVGLGVGLDGVADERAVLEPAEPALLGAERRVGGAEPLLGHVVGLEADAAQGGDAGTAGIEVAQHVGRQELRLHGGGISPDPRTTSSVGTITRRGGWSPPSSRAKASAAAWAPIRWLSWRTTVAGVASRSASSKSSKPTSATGARGAEGAQGADRVAVVAREQRGGPPVGREREQLVHDPLGLGGVVRAEADQLLAHRHAGGVEGVAVAGEALGRGEQVLAVADHGDAPVAVGEQVLDRGPRAAEVVEQHAVGLQSGRRAVEEHHRRVAGQVGVLARGGHQQQRVDPAAQQRVHQLALTLGILLARGGDQQVAALARRGLDRLGDRGVERVGDVLDDQAEGGGAHALTERAGEVVALEAELFDGVADAGGGGDGHARLLVDDPRDRLEAHAGARGDVAHGGPRAAQDAHQVLTTVSDNVVTVPLRFGGCCGTTDRRCPRWARWSVTCACTAGHRRAWRRQWPRGGWGGARPSLPSGGTSGGMTASGLGATDTGRIEAIGGLAREFYRRVGEALPGGGELPLRAARRRGGVRGVGAGGIDVFREQRLEAVVRSGDRIVELRMESGRRFRARMFVDATLRGRPDGRARASS